MCKACKMDDREVAKMYARQGAVEIEDFDDEIRYRKQPSKTQFEWSNKATRRARLKKKTRPGCPGNDLGPHIFVWTQEFENEKTVFFSFYGFHKYQREVCAGCNKRRKVEYSPRYVRRNDRAWDRLTTPAKGEPVSRWHRRTGIRPSYFNFEQYDEEYKVFRKAYIDKHGWYYANIDGRIEY